MIQLYNCIIVNYVTTNIRLTEEQYLNLKAEAAKQRKSLSAVIRARLPSGKKKGRNKTEVEKIMQELDKLAKRNAEYTRGFDSVKALREIRYKDP